MPFQINGVTAPDSFVNEGDSYIFDPAPVVALSGNGTPVTLPYATLTMHWARMQDSDYAWLVTTLLSGAASAEFTGTTQVYNHLKALTTYSHCRVYRPGPHNFRYGYHIDVTLRITELT